METPPYPPPPFFLFRTNQKRMVGGVNFPSGEIVSLSVDDLVILKGREI